ncbi:MAG: hypothetical protein QMD04_14090 [Anaerolineales bacterium]|nr:hypothetical protein [Anaerolineales bacterium]
MTPLQKGYTVIESGTFLAEMLAFHAQNHRRRLFLIAKWDANAVDFSKTTFLQ